MSTIAELLVNIGVDASDLESGMDSAASSLDNNFGKITGAGVIAGGAMEGFARKMAGPNEAIARLAARTGLGEDAMRDLAKETSNVTFPMGDVLDLMETGAQRGLEGADALQEFATFWDTVGDATGENATMLGEASAALQAVGIDAANQEDAMDAFGFITDNTTGSVGDFLHFLDRMGPDLREMGADVDDAAGLLGALEGEMGMTGRTARQELRTAISDADGDMNKVLDTLGLSEEQFKKYRDEVEGSSSVIERNAQIHADSFTPLQKLSHGAEELMTQYGGLASMAGSLAMPMMALGPISKGVSMGLKGVSSMGPMVVGAFSKVGKAFGALSKLLMANPWILLVAATIALVVLIVKNWDKIVAFLKGVWDWITETVAAVGEWFKEQFDKALEFVKNLFLNFTGPGLLIKHFDDIKAAVTKVKDWITEKFNDAIEFLKKLPGRVTDAVSGLFAKVHELVTAAQEWVAEKLDDVVSFVTELPGRISDAASGMWDGIKNAFRSAINWIIDKWNNLSFTLGGFDLPDWMGGGTAPGFTISTPNIPKLHDGGVFQAARGNEGLALLEDGETVLPADFRGGGPMVAIYGDVYGYDDFKRKVRDAGVDIQRLGWSTS